MFRENTQVELTQELDDGRRIIKTLIGEEAAKWQKWIDSVCLQAWSHHKNPPWSELCWQVQILNEQSKDEK